MTKARVHRVPARRGALAANATQHSWHMPGWLPVVLAVLLILVAVCGHGLATTLRRGRPPRPMT